MNRAFRVLTAAFPLLCCAQNHAWAAPSPQAKTNQAKTIPLKETAFTGATVRDKVRLRLQPDLNAKVVKDLGRGDLLLIVGEDNGFYRVKPDPDQKAYVYAKYVNEGKIAGERVNIRLQPDLESPILMQMRTGDQVASTKPPVDGWLEIAVPDSVVFYVAKEYVEKAGDANYLSNLRREERELRQQTELASSMGKTELQKPFEMIDLTATRKAFKRALDLSGNRSDKRAHVEQLLQDIEQAYAAKREAYFSLKPNKPIAEPKKPIAEPSKPIAEPKKPIAEPKKAVAAIPSTLEQELNAYHTKINKLDEKLKVPSSPSSERDAVQQMKTTQLKEDALERWSLIEGACLVAWAEEKGLNQASFDEFYADQRQNSRILQGILQPYTGQEQNRPGDYILLAIDTGKPVAYLYSTKVNLAALTGKPVRLVGLPRNNNRFAYPAYFVLSPGR